MHVFTLCLSTLSIFLVFAVQSWGMENPYVDSLWTAYQLEKTDTGRIDILLEIGEAHENLDTAKNVELRALEKAKLINDRKRIGIAYLNLGITLANLHSPERAMQYIDLALELFEELKDERYTVSSLNAKGALLHKQYKAIEAIEVINRSITIGRKIDYKTGLLVAYVNLALANTQSNKLDEALKYYNEALSIADTLARGPTFKRVDKYNQALLHSHIGDVHRSKRDYLLALNNFLKCLSIAEEIGDKYLESVGLTNSAILHMNLEDYEEAMGYFNKGLELVKEFNDSTEILATLMNMGYLYQKTGKIDKALNLYKESLMYATNDAVQLLPLFFLSSIYADKGDLAKAWRTQRRIKTKLLSSAQDSLLHTNLLSKLLVLDKKWEKALPYAERGLAIVKKGIFYEYDFDYDYESELLGRLIDIHKNLGQYEKALSYAKLKQEKQDRLYNQQNTRIAQRLDIEYETEKKEAAISLLEQEKKLQESQLQSQRYWITLWAILGVVGLLLSIVLFFFYRQSKRIADKEIELRANVQNLFASISHEFKTPLSILKIPLEELTQNEFKGNFQESYQMMLRNVYRLSDLVNQMLDLARLKDKYVQINLEYNEPIDFIRTFVGQFGAYAAQKNVKLLLIIPAWSLSIHYDEEALSKILNNLISNAVKFTQQGQIMVSFKYQEKAIEILVSDTGIGIKSTELPHIFDRYYFNSLGENKVLSTGLGLAVVKQLVELYGGSITVESEYGRGSTFTVLLPHQENFQKADLPTDYEEIDYSSCLGQQEVTTTLSPTPTSQLGVSLSGQPTPKDSLKKVLIVEDNIDLNLLLYNRLIKEYRVYRAFNGIEGYEMATKIVPDIIIADIMMARMDGISLAKKLQVSNETNHIPLIVISALESEEKKHEAWEAGAIDFINKPIDMSELRLKIKNLMSKREQLKLQFQKKNWAVLPDNTTLVDKDEAFLQQLREVVLSNISDSEMNVEKLSELLFMSRVSLYRKIKSLTGMTPVSLIYKIKMQYAYELLKQNRGNISEIARTVGITNVSFFSRKFREEFGTSPTKIPERQ